MEENLSFLKGSKLLVACSGGLDSVVLGFLLKELNMEIGLAHANFSLRGKESDGDEAFVINLSEKWEVPVFTETFETKVYAVEQKLSIQMAARELRYRWFEEIRKDFHYDYVVTAHHADDSLETFLINLSRGTGLKGLMGIPEVNGNTIRPLLPFKRTQIEAFAKEQQLYWREDSSNQNTDYLRNQIRHEVVPKLKGISTSWNTSFQKTQKFLQQSQFLVEDYMTLIARLLIQETDQGIEISIPKLQEMPHKDALLYELLHPFGFTAWLDISGLLSAQSGKQIVSKSHRLLKDREVLLLTEIPSEAKKSKTIIEKNVTQIITPLRMSFIPTEKVGYIDMNTIYVDADQLVFPLLLRTWKKGDVFQPFGMKGKKKLSKFFKDEKLSLASKEHIWLLESNGQIVWVIGLRADDRFKVTQDTQKILKISVSD